MPTSRIARRPHVKKRSNYAPPVVPVADEVDGLIKTADLEKDILVEFPMWTGGQPRDAYQLNLNGKAVGEKITFDIVPPVGTILQLSIPVANVPTEDGAYQVGYTVTLFPGGNLDPSPTTTIVVDRTPPGTHQLGYMDFPEQAKDGLTAEELRDMGDVLTGRIFGYSGLRKGDTIKTYWGSVAGPETVLSGEEDEEQSIDVAFTKDFLTRLPSPAGATYYTVTDRAGNTSADSGKVTIPLFLTEITPDLPPPVIDNYDGLIDHADARVGVEVKIPVSALVTEGDQILLHWGTESLGPVPVATEDLGEPFILIFDVQYATIEAARDGVRQLKYEVIRSGQIVGISSDLEVNVKIELPVPGTPDKPTVRGGSSLPSNEDNFIDDNDFELNATILINWNPAFKASQILTVYWGGAEVLEQPYVITNTDVIAGRPLLLTALNSRFKPVGTGNDIRVYYTVTATDNPNISTSFEQGIIVQSKDELPGGPEGPDAPEFTSLNENGVIERIGSAHGATIFIKPYINIAVGQVIVFTYEAYDQLVGGDKKFEWSHTSANLTPNEVDNGYHLTVPVDTLKRHCHGHVEATFQVKSDKGQGNSKRANVFIDMRYESVCSF
ncbi:hypothetical protein ASF84_14010 [Pseudomonas sp. Leaf127]|nr:hypothetical protein ASF84_14010 [Pseudomonas sp. Leaf127]